jgi:dolichol-phosphate mannosyltransferase
LVRDCIIIIPTFNEIENIDRILTEVLQQSERFDILVVDDGSPDGTPLQVKERMHTDDRIHLLERTGKSGLGTAYIAGFKWSLDRSYQYIFEMDADFSHDPADLVRLLHACEVEGGDVSVGSRYVKGGKVVNWPMNRVFLSYYASLYVRIITWLRVKDTTGGFVCYTRRALLAINLDKIRFVGYAFQIEMKYAISQMGYILREVPITFKDREQGQSKMSTHIFKEALIGVLIMRFSTMFNKKYYRSE